jgi:hypothetical protein
MTKSLVPPDDAEPPLGRLRAALGRFLSQIPDTDEPEGRSPEERARVIARNAAIKAAVASGALALPPGPLGYVTIIPELVAIWKIQAQMVADIAGTFGKTAHLSREQMMFCLFRHAAAQAMRDIVVRVGERVFIRRPTLRVFQKILSMIGQQITQRLAGRTISRWLPIVGALGVGAYAYYDTGQVAKTAIDLFRREIEFEPSGKTDGRASMSCKACGRNHPPDRVTWSERNRARQPRPYHCPICREANRADKIPNNWDTGTVAEATGCVTHGAHAPAPGGCCL